MFQIIINYQNFKYINIMGQIITTNPQYKQNLKAKYISGFLMITSGVFWVSAYIYSNENNLHPVQTSMLRGFMIVLISLCICWIKGQKLDLKINFKEVMIRNSVFLVQAFGMCWIQFYLPLSIVHTVGSTGPLYVCILQYFFEGKKLTAKQAFGMIISILGIILTTNGRFFSQLIDPQYTFESDFTNYRQINSATLTLYTLMLLAFMIIWSFGVYITNKIKVSPHEVNFLFGLKLYLISCMLFPFIIKEGEQYHSGTFYWGIIYTGLLFGVSELAFVMGIMMSINIGMTIMLGCFTIVVSYFIGIVRYSQQINLFCLAGSILLIIGLSKILLNE